MRFQKLTDRFGSALQALEAPEEAWRETEGLSPDTARRLHRECQEALKRWEPEMALLQKLGARVLIPSDLEFPAGLKALPDAPIVVYIKGELQPQDLLAVALVGTRQPTDYGRAAAERLAREFADAGVTVVSGLARGIDTVAHAAVLKRRGRTIGVLGSGLNRFYPPENRPLMERIAERGAVISEFSLATGPDRDHFPRRNRLISGLSVAVGVVECAEKSGALITARLAAEQGKDVFAVPGPIFSKGSAGPHLLLKQGARLAESAADVLSDIEIFRSLVQPPRTVPLDKAETLSPGEERLMLSLSLEPVAMETLAAHSGLSVGSLASTLLALELKGLIKPLPGRYYVRSENSYREAQGPEPRAEGTE
jgi:DNA processing protein